MSESPRVFLSEVLSIFKQTGLEQVWDVLNSTAEPILHLGAQDTESSSQHHPNTIQSAEKTVMDEDIH